MRFGEPVPAGAFAAIRRHLALEAGKWDLQIGDVSTLAPFPLLLRRAAWEQLARWAEALTAETLALEASLCRRPDLWSTLGLSRGWRPRAPAEDPAQGRVFRFDFHHTPEGWRLSEVNSDVPGGFAEATEFPALMSAHFAGTEPCGAPGKSWARSIERAAQGGVVGLLAAPGYLEDQQVTAYLARLTKGVQIQPRQVEWRGARAWVRGQAVGALVRFFQGEWLLRCPGGAAFLGASATPVLNPGLALLSESKRLPLLWEEMGVSIPTWRSLLPECREPTAAPWQSDAGWVLKKAWSNTGDFVRSGAWEGTAEWRREVRAHPREWLAQRRFETTAIGGLRPCLGVYTVDGRTAGAYGRVSPRQVIDRTAQDIAVLLETEEAAPPCARPST